MAEKIKIKVTIANRVYPLNINSANEEEGMRKAAKRINDLVTRFEQDYAVSDKQDVLAMCALQFASALEINAINGDDAVKSATKKLMELNDMLVQKLD
ncbi:MAG: cell division protein ZapA [Flavobacteriaceae bacterium]|jgi:cell division protein ZapA|nr:cell division protein ZapA [Flavobacteriaceae bacterium]